MVEKKRELHPFPSQEFTYYRASIPYRGLPCCLLVCKVNDGLQGHAAVSLGCPVVGQDQAKPFVSGVALVEGGKQRLGGRTKSVLQDVQRVGNEAVHPVSLGPPAAALRPGLGLPVQPGALGPRGGCLLVADGY